MNRNNFRAWDKVTNDWYDDASQNLVIYLDGAIYNCWNGEIMEDYSDRILLMQSTGFHDSQGIEIFEGDIVVYTQHSINYGRVFHHSYCEIYRLYTGAFRARGSHIYGFDAFSERKHLTVAGNIYKNPELLKQDRWSTVEDAK